MTRTAADKKNDLIESLAIHADPPFLEQGFKRSKRSLSYVQKFERAKQTLAVHFDSLRSDGTTDEIRISPSISLMMPELVPVSLSLIGGNKLLLANAPEVLLNQPISLCMPEQRQGSWYAVDTEEISVRVKEFVTFSSDWVFDFLAKLRTPEDLLHLYETGDPRVMFQQHSYIHLAAAAYVVRGPQEALNIVQKHFASAGTKRRFQAAHDYLGEL